MTALLMASRSKCYVDDCKNCRFRDSKFTFHAFPKESELKRKWLDAMRKPYSPPPPHSVVCSAHFTEDSYQEILGRNCLKLTAVPSIFNHYQGKGLVEGFFGKPGYQRPKGILKRKCSAVKVNTDGASHTVESDKSPSLKKSRDDNEDTVVEIKEEILDDDDMVDFSTSLAEKSVKAQPKVILNRCKQASEYLSRRNACEQTETTYITGIASTQTETSVSNPDDDLGESSSLLGKVESLKTETEKLRSHIHLLQNNLRQKEKEVDTLLDERNELSSRLNDETMSVIERAFKEVLQGFFIDDHSSLEKLLSKSNQLCLNTNISFGKNVGSSYQEQE